MQKQLPKSFTLQTNYNNKYLSYIIDEDSNVLRLISKDEYKAPDSNSEFETETSSVDDGLFVSIKSSYNNKYLVVMKSNENDDDDDDNQHLVSPIADTPNEDQSSESCTLFKPHFVGENDNNNSQVRFYHAHYKNYLSFSVTNSRLVLPSSSEDDELVDLFIFTDIEPELPSGNDEYSFRGDNMLYLCVSDPKGDENKIISHLKFCVEHNDPTNPDIWFKCHIPRDKNKLFEIKSISKDALWECGVSKWVLVDLTRESSKNTMFQFDREKSAFIINGNYCQRNIHSLEDSNKVDCYIANTPTFTEQARVDVQPKKKDDSDTKSSLL